MTTRHKQDRTMRKTSSTTAATAAGVAPKKPRNRLYKTVLCRFWSESGICRNGENCPFAHGEHERRILPDLHTEESDEEADPAELNGNHETSELIEVGKMKYSDDEKDVLGFGSEGIVFKGTFDGRPVAVKRMQKFQKLQTEVEREVQMLIDSDSGNNVIRFFCMESDKYFHYLVLELCLASLQDHVEKKMVMSLSSEEILQHSTNGVAHLHSLNIKIVHRDLKPQNVLFCSREGTVRAVIADFGLSKKLQPDMSSLSTSSGIVGTQGWTAPEALNGEKTSFPMDIFSLGLIYYYVLTNGSHPFGEQHHRNSNILKGEFKLHGLSAESHQLIHRAISSSPSSRPTAKAMLDHPFFWEAEKQLDFFCEVSDRMVVEPFISLLSNRLERGAKSVMGTDWMNGLSDELKQHLTLKLNKKASNYKGARLRDLLRLIRNMKHHFRAFPSVGDYPRGLLVYFTSRFPELLLHVHKAMEWCSEDSAFQSNYSDEVRIRPKAEMERAALYDPSNWGAKEQLVFLCRVSNRLKAESMTSLLSKRFREHSLEVVKENWIDQLCDPLRDYLNSIGQYKGWSIQDLLKVIRNMSVNYGKLPDDIRTALGEHPNEFSIYFTSRFPTLLLFVHYAMEWCSDEDTFKHYYSDEIRIQMRTIRVQEETNQE